MFHFILLTGLTRVLFGCQWQIDEKQTLLSHLPEMAFVASGTFNTGSTDGTNLEQTVHSVTITRNFYLSKHEVTNQEYLFFCNQATRDLPPNLTRGRNETNPVVYVSYNDATAYSQWLSKQTGKPYRLPTEAEWEYAARGGFNSKNYVYAGSNSANDVAWYINTASSGATYRVVIKQAHELGIYDMSGNAWEWCSDWIGGYASVATTDPIGSSTGTLRVQRGGAYDSQSVDIRLTNRGHIVLLTTHLVQGFDWLWRSEAKAFHPISIVLRIIRWVLSVPDTESINPLPSYTILPS